jgi:putative phosphoribosyl transferase
MDTPVFRNRTDAGRRIASALLRHRDSDPVVMGVPRGGVVIASEIAPAVQGRLDLMIVRRISPPGRPEATVGAIADGVDIEIFCDDALLAEHGMSHAAFSAEVGRLRYAIALQQNRYGAGRPRASVQNRAVILADDAIITGATARVALRALYKERARYVAIAVPVAVADVAQALRADCDEVIVLAEVPDAASVRDAYRDYGPVADSEIVHLMRAAPAPID